MTNKPSLAVLAFTLLFVSAAWAQSSDSDPERGVARISLINGDVSLQRGDTADWTTAAINAPMVVQDRLITGANSRAEIQFDYSNMLRVSENAELRMSQLEQRRYSVQLARGLATFRVLRNQDADVEISTTSVSVRPTKKGIYRIALLPDGSTQIAVRSGEAEIFSPRGVERLKSGHSMMVRGSASDPEFQMISHIAEDDWDRWNEHRDKDLERSKSYQYVSQDIYGAEDLDGHGRWVNVAPYGNVWTPYVSAGWAPYRSGRWSWVDYYGWTWVSYDPWGWAPYHYGRWFNEPGYGWCWWSGGLYSRHHWSPALVGFFGWGGGGINVGSGIGFGRVGWIPLAPYETYRPWYGNNYYRGHRNSNYIDNSVNVVNNVNIKNVYKNARVNNAVTAVDGTDFSRGRVTAIRTLSDGDLSRASMVRGQVPVVPERESLRLADGHVNPRVAESARSDGRFYSRRETKPVERVSFDQQRQGLESYSRSSVSPAEGGRRSADSVPATSDNQTRGSGWRYAGEGSRQANPSPAASAATDGGGWRRFGEPSRGSNASPEVRSAERPQTRTADNPSADSNGWRRFGNPSRAGTEPSATGRESGSSRSSEVDQGWRGIGTSRESRDSSGAQGSSSRTEQNPGFNSGGRRSESRSETYQPRGEQPRYENRGESRPQAAPQYQQRESPVRISPPIVQERGGGSDGGFGRSRGGGGEAPRGGGGSPAPSSGGMRGGDGGPRGGGGSPAPSSGGMRGGDGGGGRSGGGGGSVGRASGGGDRGGGRGR